MDRILLRPDEAAAAIGISRSKTYELIRKGQIPSIRIGESVRVPVGALNEWIAKEIDSRRSDAKSASTEA